MIRSTWIWLLAGSLVAIGCEKGLNDRTSSKAPPGDVHLNLEPANKTVTATAGQTKEEYQQQLDAQLKALDVEIAQLQEKSRDLKDDAKTNWEQTRLQLQAKRDAAHVKLVEVRKSSGEAWKDVKQGAQSAWDELDKAFHDASRRF